MAPSLRSILPRWDFDLSVISSKFAAVEFFSSARAMEFS